MEKPFHVIDKEGNVLKKDMPRKIRSEDELSYLKYINFGFYLAAPLVVGVFLGLWLDSKFDTKPLWTLSCIALGTIACFYNLFKLTKE